jgi:hypothetical protein
MYLLWKIKILYLNVEIGSECIAENLHGIQLLGRMYRDHLRTD